MTVSPTGTGRARFRLGEALESTFDAVFSNFPTFLLLALVLYALPNVLLIVPFGPQTQAPAGGAGSVLIMFRGIANLALSAILQGALVRGVVTHLNGARPVFSQCLRSGLSSAAPLVAIGILAWLGIAAGFVLFVIPGFFLLALWAVVGPAQVIERKGVFASFSRSADLTSGDRWAVLGSIIIMFVIALIAVGIGSAVVGLMGAASLQSGAAMQFSWGFFVLTTLISVVATTIGTIFSSALPASLYYHLRRSKEGAAPAQLASIFD